MTALIELKALEVQVCGELPPDIAAMRQRLEEARAEVAEYRRVADGLFMGKVGLDGLVGLIPIIGEVYSLYAATILIQQAIKAKCSWSTILGGVVMMAIDVAIGTWFLIGDLADLFFRSHAWFGGMVLSEIDEKLAHIDLAHRILSGSAPPVEGSDLTTVRDHLFRSGKTEQAVYLRIGAVAVVCMFMMHECRRAQEARLAAVSACEMRGGWFCSLRN